MSHISEAEQCCIWPQNTLSFWSEVKNITCQILIRMGVLLQGREGGHKKLRSHIFMPFVQMMKFWVACKLPEKVSFLATNKFFKPL